MSDSKRGMLESTPEIRRFFLENVRPTGTELGAGSYGSVLEVEVDGLICAAKKIHAMLIDSRYQDVQVAAQKYVAECQLMSDLRHPHIVQFLGLCFLDGSPLPALVMEKLLTSLDDTLENTPNLPLGLKKSLLSDVAKGLIYLHNHKPNPIIHRDLSAKNVLLNSSMVAKISDLGNARMVELQPGQNARTLSRFPGTLVYMPPEALGELAPTRYGPSLDIFSFGHVALFTLTQVFPGDLLRYNYPDPDRPRFLIARSEVKRREPYFTRLYTLLDPSHPLVELVKVCLDNDPDYRPSAAKVLQRLEEMEIEDPYQHLTKLDLIRMLQQQANPDRNDQITSLQMQLQQTQLDMSESRVQKDRIIQEKDKIIREKEETIQKLLEEIRKKDILPHQRKEYTQQDGSEKYGTQPQAAKLQRHANLEFQEVEPLPTPMEDAHAVIYKETLYVGGGFTLPGNEKFIICLYHFQSDTWNTVKAPTSDYALAVYQEQLVLAGGRLPGGGSTPTNQLWQTNQELLLKQTIPLLTTPVYGGTAIATKTHLIVVGGHNGGSTVDTVQVYNGFMWIPAQPLPGPTMFIKYTFLDNILYFIGGGNQGRKVYCTSLPVLVESTQHPNAMTHTVWKTLTDAAHARSSVVVLQSVPVAIGGGYYSAPSSTLCMYSHQTSMWEKMESELPRPLTVTCSIALSASELMVIGGLGTEGRTSYVYKATVVG